jgi:ABC-type Fe3+-hydroxamate transport system substrate-binding protein
MRLLITLTTLLIVLLAGCSNAGTSVTTSDNPLSGIDTESGISDFADSPSSIGLMGIYEMTINPDDLTVNLNPKRVTSVGESYIVSGIGFFTSVPCADCLKLKSLAMITGGIRLSFSIRHPFNPGNI